MSIIVNGGFESGALSPGWRQTPGSAVLDGGVTNATSYSGDYCLELKGMDFVEQVLFFKKGTSDLSFQTKIDNIIGGGPSYVTIVYADGTATTHGPIPSSTKWQKVNYPVDTDKCISIIRFSAGETAPRYIDDVSLEGERCFFSIRKEIPDFLRELILSWEKSMGYGHLSLKEEKEYIMALEDRLFYLEKQLTSLLSKESKPKKGSKK